MMISLGGWKAALAAGGIAVLALGWAVYERKDAQYQAGKREAAERVAKANLAALDAHRKRADDVNVVLMQERDRARQSADTASRALRALTSAPDRGEPIGEALDALLDALGPKVAK